MTRRCASASIITRCFALPWNVVATVAPPLDRLHPDLKPAVLRALSFGDKYNREFAIFLDQFLDERNKIFAGENLKRGFSPSGVISAAACTRSSITRS